MIPGPRACSIEAICRDATQGFEHSAGEQEKNKPGPAAATQLKTLARCGEIPRPEDSHVRLLSRNFFPEISREDENSFPYPWRRFHRDVPHGGISVSSPGDSETAYATAEGRRKNEGLGTGSCRGHRLPVYHELEDNCCTIAKVPRPRRFSRPCHPGARLRDRN